MEPERSIVVFGAGAVGGYLGGKLASDNPDCRVTLIGRQRFVDAIAEHGLIIREEGAETVARPGAVTSSDALGPVDMVVLTVRTYDVTSALPDVGRLTGPDTYVVAMQNGVGTEECIGDTLGRDRVIVGTMTAAVRAEAPGVIERIGDRGGLALAPMRGGMPPWIPEVFASSGLPTDLVKDYRSLRWSKLLLTILGAATSSILDMDLSAIVEDRRIFRIEQRVFAEAAHVMDAQHIDAVRLPGYPVRLTRRLMRMPLPISSALVGSRLAKSRGGRSPAMRSDLQRGKTEVQSLNGAVARAAEILNLRAPTNRALTELIEELSSKPEKRGEFRGNPETLIAYLHEHGVRK
jgi:2-dehydropantoate 2-reductase